MLVPVSGSSTPVGMSPPVFDGRTRVVAKKNVRFNYRDMSMKEKYT